MQKLPAGHAIPAADNDPAGQKKPAAEEQEKQNGPPTFFVNSFISLIAGLNCPAACMSLNLK